MYDKQLEPMNYFDRRSNEEDLPVMVNDATQERYKHLDAIYEKFFDENSLNTAKVYLY